MIGREYVVLFEGISVSAAQDLLELQAPADSAVVILEAWANNESSETSEQAGIALKRGEGAVTSGSGGSSVTPIPAAKGDPAFGGTCERNNTTKLAAGSGALKVLDRQGVNFVGSGYHWQGELVISPSDFAALELIGAPGGATTLSGGLRFREIGG